MLKKISWVLSYLMNTFVIFRTNQSALFTDNLFMLIGRLIGIYLVSYLILSPLYLIKKKDLVKKLLPFVYLVISILLVFIAIVNYSQEDSTSLNSNQEVVENSGFVITLSSGWQKRDPTGENMILLATKDNNVLTVHQRENSENITFTDLSEDEKKVYADFLMESTKSQFEAVEFLENSFMKIKDKEIFYMVYRRTISGSKTINLSYQFFDGKLYTLTAISPEEEFASNRQDIEQIFESFNPNSI